MSRSGWRGRTLIRGGARFAMSTQQHRSPTTAENNVGFGPQTRAKLTMRRQNSEPDLHPLRAPEFAIRRFFCTGRNWTAALEKQAGVYEREVPPMSP